MKDLFPKPPLAQNFYGGDFSYEELIESFGVETLLTAELGDYSGDYLTILRDNLGRFGFLSFGYGSCSGCDSLQSCESLEEVVTLRDQLWEDTHWGTASELKVYLDDPELITWYRTGPGFGEFVAKALTLLWNS